MTSIQSIRSSVGLVIECEARLAEFEFQLSCSLAVYLGIRIVYINKNVYKYSTINVSY